MLIIDSNTLKSIEILGKNNKVLKEYVGDEKGGGGVEGIGGGGGGRG